MKEKKTPRISFQSDNLAVPEIKIGAVPEPEELEEDTEEIQFDNLAVPEIHIKRAKPKD